MASFNPYSSPTNNSEKTPIKLVSNMYARSTPVAPLSQADLAAKTRVPALIQPAALTPAQKVAALKERATAALLNVAGSRKVLYDIIIDIKEHFQEYGFKSAAAGVETVIPRTKRWANNFMMEMEAELEINKVGNEFPTQPDNGYGDKTVTLKALSRLPDPKRQDEPEKPHIKTRDEILAEQKPEPRKATENGKPKRDLAVWAKAMDCGGAFLRAVDEINRVCPNKGVHDRAISTIQDAMRLVDAWRTKGC